ncbi:MAG: TldD/PmbA family protein [Clostridia bacterium]
MNKNNLKEIAQKLLDYSSADQTQLVFNLEKKQFSRFNENFIHQNLVNDTVSLEIKVVVNNRLGGLTVSSINDLDSLKRSIDKAIAIAKMQPKNNNFKSFPDVDQEVYEKKIDQELLNFDEFKRAKYIKHVIDFAKNKNLVSNGTFSIVSGQKLVANSLGLNAYSPYCQGFFRTIMNNGNCTGYTDNVINNINEFDVLELAQTAADKALVCNDPIRIKPGKYTVLLEPIAVADLLRFAGMHTFSGKSFEENQSYFSEHMNEIVIDERLSITDNAHHEKSPLLPFDDEGVMRKEVEIIKSGKANDVVYDSMTAYKHDKQPTGHVGSYNKPMPAFMIMPNGNKSKEELISQMDEGIIITRFHYTSCPEPYRVVATGTSRDGTLWVENGKITKRINNIRFTQSVLDTFSNVIEIGNDLRPTRDWWSSFISLLPSLLVKDFNITGTTTF